MDDSQALERWDHLNLVLGSSDEGRCSRLLAREQEGKRRLTIMLRIHSRLNRVRAERERAELRELASHAQA